MSADKPVVIHGGPRVASMEESDRVEVEPVRKSCAVVVSCAVVLCFFFSCKLAVANLPLFRVGQTWMHLSTGKVRQCQPLQVAGQRGKQNFIPTQKSQRELWILARLVWVLSGWLQDKSKRILGSDSLNMDILFQSVLVVFYTLCKFLSCGSFFFKYFS